MPKLIVSLDGIVIKNVTLTKNRTTLGRRPYNDVVIDNLAISGEHAVIHSSIPVIDNVGVLVNDTVYYPGDSLFVPEVSFELLVKKQVTRLLAPRYARPHPSVGALVRR